MSKPDEIGASSEAIKAHYDLGDDFFALWLDPQMVYSCALFDEGDSLETAQLRKINYHIAQSRAAGRRRVLDVGCGWGAMLRRLVGIGVKTAVGLTLSESQASKIRREAVPGTLVFTQSWANHKPSECYDAIICVGALEHFVRQELSHDRKIGEYRRFFEFCSNSLARNGRLSLQTIAYSLSPEAVDPFVPTKIFPESDLPHLWEIIRASEGLFEVITLRNDRRDYMRTCLAWAKNLAERRAEAVALVGVETTRNYERYLAIATAAFRVGTLCLLRITFERTEKRLWQQQDKIAANRLSS